MKKFLIFTLFAILILKGEIMAKDMRADEFAPIITQSWDKVFAKSDKVEHKKVMFKNHYGIVLVGDLYTPKNLKTKASAIAVAGAFGAVKEQISGLYAQTLAQKGFITLALTLALQEKVEGQHET